MQLREAIRLREDEAYQFSLLPKIFLAFIQTIVLVPGLLMIGADLYERRLPTVVLAQHLLAGPLSGFYFFGKSIPEMLPWNWFLSLHTMFWLAFLWLLPSVPAIYAIIHTIRQRSRRWLLLASAAWLTCGTYFYFWARLQQLDS